MSGILLAAIVVLLGLAPSPALGHGDPGGLVTVRHGVQLSISAPLPSYPRDGLVEFTVSVKNLSPIGEFLIPICDRANPGIQVLTPRGRVRYPPALHFITIGNPVRKFQRRNSPQDRPFSSRSLS